jgi:hypothetical protein
VEDLRIPPRQRGGSRSDAVWRWSPGVQVRERAHLETGAAAVTTAPEVGTTVVSTDGGGEAAHRRNCIALAHGREDSQAPTYR